MYGIKVKDSVGKELLDTSKDTWIVLDFKSCIANSTTNYTLTNVYEFTEFKAVQHMLFDIPDNQIARNADISLVKNVDNSLTVNIAAYEVPIIVVVLGR